MDKQQTPQDIIDTVLLEEGSTFTDRAPEARAAREGQSWPAIWR